MEDVVEQADSDDPLPPAADMLVERVRAADLELRIKPPQRARRLGSFATRRARREVGAGARSPLTERAVIAELGRQASQGVSDRSRTA